METVRIITARVASKHHDQPAPVLAIDNDPGEGQQKHGGQSLQNHQRAQGHLGMRRLQDVPGYSGRVHAAAQHGNHVSQKNETKSPLLQDGAHVTNFKSATCKSAFTNPGTRNDGKHRYVSSRERSPSGLILPLVLEAFRS
jgi:hypothetical protein